MTRCGVVLLFLLLELGCVMNDGTERMPFDESGMLVLRGPSAQILELQRDGLKTIQWAPDDKRVLDLELRAYVVDFQPRSGIEQRRAPVVRYSLRYGHGVGVVDVPASAPIVADAAENSIIPNILPARGLVLRLSSRECLMRFYSPCRLDDQEPYDVTKLAISVQPTQVVGSALPREQYAQNRDFEQLQEIKVNLFPPEASEWRLYNGDGQPYPPSYNIPENRVNLANLAGAWVPETFGAFPELRITDLADWRPIPVHAIGWYIFPNGPVDPNTLTPLRYNATAAYR